MTTSAAKVGLQKPKQISVTYVATYADQQRVVPCKSTHNFDKFTAATEQLADMLLLVFAAERYNFQLSTY